MLWGTHDLTTLTRVLCIAYALCSFGGIGAASAQQDTPTDDPALKMLEGYAQHLARDVREGWPEAERIWPGSNFQEIAVIMATAEASWLITPQEIEKLSPEVIAQFFRPEGLFWGQDITWAPEKTVKKAIVINATYLLRRFRSFMGTAPSASVSPESPIMNTAMEPHGSLSGSVASHWGHSGHNCVFGLTYDDPAKYDNLSTKGQFAVNNDVSRIFGFAAHEAFHIFVQEGWPTVEGSRDTLYPAPSRPRAYRALMFGTLRQAYRDPGQRQQFLAQAAHWHKTWQDEFAGDAKAHRWTDYIEGTASYFDTALQMAILKKRNEGATDWQAYDATENFPVDWDTGAGYRTILSASASSEAYRIGALAGLTLDTQGAPWRGDVTGNAAPPLDVLLEEVTPEEHAPPQDFFDRVEATIRQAEAQVAPYLDAFIDSFTTPKPNESLVIFNIGERFTYRIWDHVRSPKLPDDLTLYVGMTAEFPLKNGRAEFKAAIVAGGATTACNDEQFGFLAVVPSSAVREENGRTRIDTASVILDTATSGTSMGSYEGRPALCVH